MHRNAAWQGDLLHPLHDIEIDANTIEESLRVVIEIPQGSKNKYELDKDTGLLRLDRVLYSAVHYPANYGFVPRTHCDDGDPLDVLVLGQEPVPPLTIVEVRILGVMRMRDEKGIDDKLIAVSSRDPAVADYHSLNDIPAHTLRELKRFFVDYKVLEHKEVLVEAPLGRMEALRTLHEAFALYKKEFGAVRKRGAARRKGS